MIARRGRQGPSDQGDQRSNPRPYRGHHRFGHTTTILSATVSFSFGGQSVPYVLRKSRHPKGAPALTALRSHGLSVFLARKKREKVVLRPFFCTKSSSPATGSSQRQRLNGEFSSN